MHDAEPTPASEFFGIRLPAALAAELRRRARADDRSVSGYVRRLLAAAVLPGEPETPADEPRSAKEPL